MGKIEIGRVAKKKPYQYADTLEVLCAFDGQTPVSSTDAISLISNAVAPGEESLDADQQDLDDNSLDDSLDGTTINSDRDSYTADCFAQLEFRAASLKDLYPFEVDQEKIALKSKLSELNIVYLILLAASRIRSFTNADHGFSNSISKIFEIISLEALKEMMPSDAEVRGFGVGSSDRTNFFGTNLLDALPKLAEFMGMELTPRWDNQLSSSGDAKIDLVGAQILDCHEGGWNVYLGQCAAREEADAWGSKSHEADIDYHRALFSSLVSTQGVLFIPCCFRQSNGEWFQRRYSSKVILMDRLRIMRRLERRNKIPPEIIHFYSQKLQY